MESLMNRITDVPGIRVGHASDFDAMTGCTVVLCPDGAEFCNPEIGGWPHTALLCRVERENSDSH